MRSSILSIFLKLGFKLSNCVVIFGSISFSNSLQNILIESQNQVNQSLLVSLNIRHEL